MVGSNKGKDKKEIKGKKSNKQIKKERMSIWIEKLSKGLRKKRS